MNTGRSSYVYISKYRAELMGLCILWVLLFHSNINPGAIPVRLPALVLKALKTTGYIGVDVFLFLSGMGIYGSLKKNRLSLYTRNRLRRILPVWWTDLFLRVVLGALFFGEYYSASEIAGDAFFVSFWLGMRKHGDWFVFAIMLFYLIAPVLFRLIERSSSRARTCLWLTVIALAVSFLFFGKFKLIVFARLPVFIAGMYLAAFQKDTVMTKKRWIVCLAVCAASFAWLAAGFLFFHDSLWTYGMWWYPMLPGAPALSLILCRSADFLPGALKHGYAMLRVLGRSSLEILLASDFFITHAEQISPAWMPDPVVPLAAVLAGIAAGLVLHRILAATVFKTGSP